jgi:ABC-type spermidine/putrescine transport system permease subunit II
VSGPRRPARGADRRRDWPWITYLVFIVLLLLAPLGIIILMSFNSSLYGTFPIHWSTEWYTSLVHQSALLSATWLSLELSAEVAIASAVIGSMLAIWMVRFGRRLVPVVQGILVTTMTVPWLILGISMDVVLDAAGLERTYFTLFLANLAVLLPFSAILVAARLASLDPSLEEAAGSLGARPTSVIMRITAPQLAPAIIGATIIAFVFCFNNFVIQYFLVPFGVQTLPLEIYDSVKQGYSPVINALGTVIVAITIVVLVALQRLIGGVTSSSRQPSGSQNVVA